jgi:hypothetical protein
MFQRLPHQKLTLGSADLQFFTNLLPIFIFFNLHPIVPANPRVWIPSHLTPQSLLSSFRYFLGFRLFIIRLFSCDLLFAGGSLCLLFVFAGIFGGITFTGLVLTSKGFQLCRYCSLSSYFMFMNVYRITVGMNG